MNARSSVASCASARRSSSRSCAGSSIVSRRGYAPMAAIIADSAVAMHDEIRELAQPRGAAFERRDRGVRIGQELQREFPGSCKAEDARVGRLAFLLVLAGGL